MTEAEEQTYIDKMHKERGYVLDFHKVMCADDFECSLFERKFMAGKLREHIG